MDIVMIGPVYPYRGGIAHYTALMVQALSKKHNVTTVSYKLQYPKILYPRNTQKDYENTSFKIEDTQYLLNTINPVSYLRTANYIKKFKPDLVIVQWWHPFFAPSYRCILGKIKKKCKIIFLCHNVLPHEKFPMQKLLAKMTLRKGNAFVVQSKSDEEDLIKLIPDARFIRTVLPTYNAFDFTGVSREQARLKLKLNKDAKVLLFFGFVREYKGLKYLIDAMPKVIEALPDCMLLVVGDILEREKEGYIQRIEQTGCKDSIKLVSDYVPDSEVENYFSASDLVVLPYESATQSAVAQISFGFNKPVIVTNVGGLPEVVSEGKTGYIIPPKDHKQLSSAIIKFFGENNAGQWEENIKAESHRFSWDRLVEIVEKLY
ncbi:MAG: glycosyltransferase [Oscillospiraceae bacterium]|nr:glycosyltransferase [Oscillospiraceae bacterium]